MARTASSCPTSDAIDARIADTSSAAAIPFADDVGDDHAPPLVVQRDELVVVAADLQRGLMGPGDVEPGQVRGREREEIAHDLPGQCEVAIQPTFVNDLRLKTRALDRAGNRQSVD